MKMSEVYGEMGVIPEGWMHGCLDYWVIYQMGAYEKVVWVNRQR